MQTFQERYYELFNKNILDGCRIDIAQCLALQQIQAEVARYGIEYSFEARTV